MIVTPPSLTALYAARRPVRIAHRGASGLYPENTLLAMKKAVALGADMIEFDLRLTKDGVPVLLHDRTIDRTSDGQGEPGAFTLAELRQFNFSFCRDIWGARNSFPSYDQVPIPTFEEILAALSGTVAMNIQVYDDSEPALRTILALYRRYDMYDRGFLAMSSFEAAERVRVVDPEAEVAILGAWNRRTEPDELRACRAFGTRFVQPPIETLKPETFDLCRELGLFANVFFSDTDRQNRDLVARGAAGILTNRIDLLVDTCASL